MNANFVTKEEIEKYSDIIYRNALRYLRNRDDADDIVQEVLEKYVNSVKVKGNFPTKDYERYWIVRVTKNLCINELKSARLRNNVPLDESRCIYEMDFESHLVDDCLMKLKDKYRIVMELFYIQDLKIADISKILKITQVTVRARLKRARDKLEELAKIEGKYDNEF